MVFYYVHPLDNNKKEMLDYIYDLDKDMFVKVNKTTVRGMEKNKFFMVEDNISTPVRRKNAWKQEIINDHNRDVRTLKRRELKKLNSVPKNAMFVLSNPHRYVHKVSRPSKHKFVFDVLNNTFYAVSAENYLKFKFNKFPRGSLIKYEYDEWRRIGGTKVKFETELGEIEAFNLQGLVGEKLLYWESKLKYEKHCEHCINKQCRQPALVNLMECKKYTPKNGERKRRF